MNKLHTNSRPSKAIQTGWQKKLLRPLGLNIVFTFFFLLLQQVAQAETLQKNSQNNTLTEHSSKQNDQLHNQKQLDALLANIKSIKAKLTKKMGKQSKLQKKFKQTELEIADLAATQHRLSQTQKSLGIQLKKLREEQTDVEVKQQQQKKLIGEHLRKAYEIENQNPIQLLIQEGNPAEIDRLLIYLQRINNARTTLLADYAELLKHQKSLASEVTRKQQQLTNNQKKLAQQKNSLAELQTQRDQSIKQLSKEINSDEKQVSTMTKERAALEALLKEMSQATEAMEASQANTQYLEQLPDFKTAKGKLPWPTRGKQKHRYGSTRNNSDITWQGVTIEAKAGSAVNAIFPGRVVFSDWFQGQGLLIIIDHGKGYWSLYGHNQSLLQSVGNTVGAGETIATAGKSGGQEVAGLYFEIRHNGKPKNPNNWCK